MAYSTGVAAPGTAETCAGALAAAARGAEPAAFDDTDYGLGIGVEDGRAALAAFDVVAEEEKLGGRRGFFQLCGFVGKDCACGAVFAGGFEALRVLQVDGMEREREDGLAGSGGLGGKGQVGDAEVGGEGVGCDAKNGDVMRWVGGDNGGLQQAGRGIGAANDQVRLATVAKSIEDVGVGEQIALLVDEEGVAEEDVMIAARRGRFVEAVDDGADGGVRCGAGGKIVGGQAGEGPGENG
jgi:hypothetical protein